MLALQYLLFLAPFVSAAPGKPNKCDMVAQSIENIDRAVRDFTDATNAYNGGREEAKPIFDTSTDIHAANRPGFYAALSSSKCTQPQSKKIADNVNNLVAKSIPPAYKLLESKKPLFDQAELSSIVSAFVNKIRVDHESISLAIAKVLTVDQVIPAGKGAAIIEAAFVEASAVYAISGER